MIYINDFRFPNSLCSLDEKSLISVPTKIKKRKKILSKHSIIYLLYSSLSPFHIIDMKNI